MHVVLKPRREVFTVEFKGKVYEVALDGGGAFVPRDLGAYMVAQDLVRRGTEPDPKPRWERVGDAHGKPLDPYEPYVKEIARPPATVDELVAQERERQLADHATRSWDPTADVVTSPLGVRRQ